VKAAAITSCGGPHVLHVLDLPDPKPAGGQVEIDVAYVGINFAAVSAASSGRLPRPPVPAVSFNISGQSAAGLGDAR
jgi:NADPH:quinone reductase